MGPRRIITEYVHPPIPARYRDWCAFYEGNEEDGPFGWGPTEQDAKESLLEQTTEVAL